ncbi:MAG: hypothetical protein KGZ68_12700 [Dechloromonas sp.]|nr:hypothetical protein [Dechloromonas sp.]
MKAKKETPRFVPEKHYRLSSKIGDTEFEHTHWRKNDEEKLTSLLSVDVYIGITKDAGTQRASFSLWDVTPAQLRDLSVCMAAAAADLEAHIQQVEQQEGGVKC